MTEQAAAVTEQILSEAGVPKASVLMEQMRLFQAAAVTGVLRVAAVLVVFLLGRMIIHHLMRGFRAGLERNRRIDKGMQQFLLSAVRFGLYALLIMAILTIVRMTALSDSQVYRQNALMNANPFFLGMALLIFGMFNAIFIGGFFRTAYRFSRPFVTYIIAGFLTVGAAEALHHFPGLEKLNAFGFDHIGLQLLLLFAGAALYALLTGLSYKKAAASFEAIDL